MKSFHLIKKGLCLQLFFFFVCILIPDLALAKKPTIKCFNKCTQTPCPIPEKGEKFYGYGQWYENLIKFLDKKNINGDYVVVDANHSLMWQQSTADTDGDGQVCYIDKVTWEQARTYCNNLSLAGYTDWRLPTLFELLSIVSPRGQGNPVINACCFKCRICSYWSSTTVKGQDDYAWEVYFYNGNAYWAQKTSRRYVLCVRSITH